MSLPITVVTGQWRSEGGAGGAGRTGRHLLGAANGRKLSKKYHGKNSDCIHRLLQLSTPDSASDKSSKCKELDIDSYSALTLLQWVTSLFGLVRG